MGSTTSSTNQHTSALHSSTTNNNSLLPNSTQQQSHHTQVPSNNDRHNTQYNNMISINNNQPAPAINQSLPTDNTLSSGPSNPSSIQSTRNQHNRNKQSVPCSIESRQSLSCQISQQERGYDLSVSQTMCREYIDRYKQCMKRQNMNHIKYAD